MKRLFIICLVATTFVATACDPWGRDSAATVGDTVIPVAEVTALAGNTTFLQAQGVAPATATVGRVDGTAARAALDYLIGTEILRKEAAKVGVPVKPAGSNRSGKALYTEGTEVRSAVTQGAVAELSTAQGPAKGPVARRLTALARAWVDSDPGRFTFEVTCLDGVTVDPSGAAAVRAAVAAGTGYADIAADTKSGATQVLNRDGSKVCTASSGITQPQIQKLKTGGSTELNVTVGSGQQQTAFVTVTARRNATAAEAADEIFGTVITDLQGVFTAEQGASQDPTQRGAAVVAVEKAARSWVALVRKAPVSVDSRFGDWTPPQGVIAPPAPTAIAARTVDGLSPAASAAG